MPYDLQVHAEALRTGAAALAEDAARIAATAAQVPPPVPVPRWSAAEAAGSVADGVRYELGAIAGALWDTAGRIRAAGDDYEHSDDRAARRLADAGQARGATSARLATADAAWGVLP
jgi:hypothetical protein